jgi:hypothetical protein
MFDVTVRSGNAAAQMTVEIPEEVVLYSPMTEVALKRLRPGQTLTLFVLDPVSMQKEGIVVKAVRRETIRLGGETREAMRLAMQYRDKQLTTWVDERGGVLRQETPIGFSMEKCTPQEAFAALDSAAGGEDILKALTGEVWTWL